MSETDPTYIDRTRTIIGVHNTQNTPLNVALGILITLGIGNTVQLNALLDGGDFEAITAEAQADAQARTIETTHSYPDALVLLGDGAVLIAQTSEGYAKGGSYTDRVLPPPPPPERPAPEGEGEGTADTGDAYASAHGITADSAPKPDDDDAERKPLSADGDRL